MSRKRLGTHLSRAADGKTRHLSIRVGRVECHWCNNGFDVGLYQGCIEPLEVTALMLMQFTLTHFIDQFSMRQFTKKYQSAFNRRTNHLLEDARDFVIARYYLNARNDAEADAIFSACTIYARYAILAIQYPVHRHHL